MLTILKIIGIVALVVVIGVVLAIRWFIRRVRGFVEENHVVPCRIRPEPEANPQWRHPEVIPTLAAAFRDAGFVDVGTFSIPELRGLQFLAFRHPQDQFYGCVYDHPKLAPTFDVVCRCVDGTAVTGTNTRMGEALEQRPGHVAVRMEGATVADVLNAVRQHPGATKARVPATAEEFLGYFQKAHADYMNWRLAKGGTSREEIRRQAAQDGQEVDDEVIEETYQSMREAYVEQLKDGCVAQYLDEARIPAADWEHRQTALVAVPETLEVKEVIETLESAVSLDDEQRHQLEQVEKQFGQDGIAVVSAILDRNVGSLGLRKVAEVTEPVRAWILEVPASATDAPGAGGFDDDNGDGGVRPRKYSA